ncbi:MAG: hypothetical protein WKG07_26245 [Hymenobacter sp.]
MAGRRRRLRWYSFIPADFDEKTYTKPLQAYDKDGQVHLLDAKKTPDYPVVVIGPSERVKGTALTSENFGPGRGRVRARELIGRRAGKAHNRPLPEPRTLRPLQPPPTPPTTPTGQPYATCRTDKQNEYLTAYGWRT